MSTRSINATAAAWRTAAMIACTGVLHGCGAASNPVHQRGGNPLEMISEERLVRLTQDMVRINTEFAKGIVHNHQEMAEYLARQLQDIGVEYEVVYPEEPFEAPYHAGLNVPYPGNPRDFPVVIARIRGTRGSPVLGFTQLYNSVVIGDRSHWTVDPLGGDIIDGRIYGRGATNSKASVATYLEALRVIRQSGVELEGDLIVALTPGEGATEFGVPWVVQNRPELLAADWYLMGCCGPNFTKHGGHVWAKLIVHGAMHHPISGAQPNAVVQMAQVVPRVTDVKSWMTWEPEPLFGDREPYIEVTQISSGNPRDVAVNVMPARVEALLDIRIYPNQEPQQLIGELNALLDQLMKEDPELAVELEVTGVQKVAGEVWDAITEDDPLVQHILQMTRDYTGNGDVRMEWRSGFAGGRPDFWNTGAKVIYSGGIRTGGGGGGGAHSPDEFVSIDGLVPRTKLLVDVAMRALGGKIVAPAVE